MLELVVASGKGGTGKTSIAGSLACLAGRCVLVDCDVDAANLHLIINHKTAERHDFSTGSKASIIESECTACGICGEKCRFDAIEHIDNNEYGPGGTYRVIPHACEGCGLCVELCPERAIKFERVISGEWYHSVSDYGPFLHARLGIAQANSGKLVSLLRNRAREICTAESGELIIIDGPPGIGCPVIAAVGGASYLLIVTEPSLSAIHDMKRLFDLAGHFGVRTGLVINKYDLNGELTREIESYAFDANITVHGRIAFDTAFVDAQLKGVPYIREAGKENSDNLKRIWRSLRETIEKGERKYSADFKIL